MEDRKSSPVHRPHLHFNGDSLVAKTHQKAKFRSETGERLELKRGREIGPLGLAQLWFNEADEIDRGTMQNGAC